MKHKNTLKYGSMIEHIKFSKIYVAIMSLLPKNTIVY